MERIKTQPQDEERLPFTAKVTIDDESIKKSWDRIRTAIINRLAANNDLPDNHENKRIDAPSG